MTYNRYIIRSILPNVIIVTMVLTTFVWITRMIRLLYLFDKGVSIVDFLSIVILLVPSLLFSVMPVITLIAVLSVYNRLKEERQIIVLQNAGLSDFAIAKPAIIVALLLTIFSFFISAYLLPLSYNSLKEKINLLRNNYISSVVDVRKFNQMSKYNTIYIDKKDNSGNLEGIILFDNTIPSSKSVIFAQYGNVYIQQNEILFELNNGLRQAYDNNNHITRMHFDNLTVKIAHDVPEMNQRSRSNLELYIHEMLFPKGELDESKKIRLIAEGHNRIIWPLFNFIFVFLTLSFFLKIKFSRHFEWKPLFLCLVPTILVAFIHFTLQKYSYMNLDILYLCYGNVLLCIIFSIWQLNKKMGIGK